MGTADRTNADNAILRDISRLCSGPSENASFGWMNGTRTSETLKDVEVMATFVGAVWGCGSRGRHVICRNIGR